MIATMATSKGDIRRWFEEGVKQKATHLIVVCDTYDWEDYPVYVKPTEVCEVIYEQKNSASMQRVMEIYDLQKDMETQINSGRAWSI